MVSQDCVILLYDLLFQWNDVWSHKTVLFYCMACYFSGMMYGLTRLMNISFDLNDSFFFGAIISATDPGNNSTTVKTCVKQPLKNRQNKDLNDKW